MSASTSVPSSKRTLPPSSCGDVSLGRDRPVLDAVEDPSRDGRVSLAEAVVGLGQAVALGRPGVAPEQGLGHPLAHLEGHPGVVAELVDRFAEDVLGHDPDALAGRQVGALGDIGGLDGDVHRRVAHAEHHHPLAGEDRVLDVGVGVHLLARERVGAGERRFGPAGVPVVPVGDDQIVIDPGLSRIELDAPGAVLGPVGVDHRGLEGDPVAKAEVVDVFVEIGGDLSCDGESPDSSPASGSPSTPSAAGRC